MNPKTENLAIVLTDIVGYTEATAHQSRSENERLLATHNHILLPIIKSYKGKLIKSIGDALLIIFRSPTDAMLCAMAMQDALFEYNRNVEDSKTIHIRVAASLGEVRVTRNDIFGEAVNITSRIESIAPKDEIYLSEAVYMAMNKAEVPCKEVGWKELKGISQPIRIYHIPRFSTPRLVPEDVMGSEDISDLVYPYGGAHLAPGHTATEGLLSSPRGKKRLAAGLSALVVLGALAAALSLWMPGDGRSPSPAPAAAVTPKRESAPKAPPRAESAPPSAAPSVKAASTPPPAVRPAPRPTPTPRPAPKVEPKPKPVTQQASARPTLPVLRFDSIRKAKIAFKNDKITKEEYKDVIYDIKVAIKSEAEWLRGELDAGRIDKAEYKREYVKIREKYE